MKKSIDKKSKKGQDLRNSKVFDLAASGMPQDEIAKEVGLSRSSVNRILNSDEAKELVDKTRNGLANHLAEAVETLVHAMSSRHTEDSKDIANAVKAATTILKGLGVLTDEIKVNDSKPFIVQFLDGSEMQMGFGKKDVT